MTLGEALQELSQVGGFVKYDDVIRHSSYKDCDGSASCPLNVLCQLRGRRFL